MTQGTQTSDTGTAPVLADALFWSVTAIAVALASGPLSQAWGTPRSVLITLALVIAGTGIAAVPLLRPGRRMPRSAMKGLGLANLAITVAALLVALTGWLGLPPSGNASLAVVGAITLAFGVWQLRFAQR